MSGSDSPILLMTATIKPPLDAINLKRVDVALRMADYKAALAFYLRMLERGAISAIVFAENSNVDIHELHELAAASPAGSLVEFLQFDGLDHPGSYGRGYGEFKLLDYAMRQSRNVAAADPSAQIWKVTGRYLITNLEKIMRRRNGSLKMWVHCRNYPGRWADMYVMGWRRDFYARFLEGVYTQLNEQETGISERAFRFYVDELAARERVARRLHPVPEVSGVRGFDGKNYADARLKRVVRGAMQVVAPWVWI